MTSDVDNVPGGGLGEALDAALDRLRAVLIARHGIQVGRDLHGELTSYAWEHRERLATMDNPAGFLYRVSQSRARRYRRWGRTVDLPPEEPAGAGTARGTGSGPGRDLDLAAALATLPEDDRTIVVIVHSYGYRYEEAAELLGLSVGAVRNRLHRAMTTLRRLLDQEEPT